MINPLSSAVLKISRARKHIADIEEEIEDFRRGQAYRTYLDYDSEPGRTLIKLSLLRVPKKEIVLCGAADAVQNLRCALDHLSWQVYSQHCKTVKNNRMSPTNVKFTFYQHKNEYINNKNKEKLRQIGGESWLRFLDDVKPYRDGNDLLCALNDANNLDKHRHILRLGSMPTEIAVSSPLGVPVKLDGFRSWDFEDEITIASYSGRVEEEHKVKTSLNVVFSDIIGIENEPVIETLYKFSDVVTEVLEKGRTRFFA